MAETTPQSPSASNKTTGGDHPEPMGGSSEPRHDGAPLPSPPASSTPAAAHGSPPTAFNISELRERVDGVLHSDVSIGTFLCAQHAAHHV